MAALALENYAGSPDELLEQARQVAKTPESAELLLAAVNKRLAEVAPGEEPVAAAKRLTAERDDWAIEAGHRYLNEYYEDSLDPQTLLRLLRRHRPRRALGCRRGCAGY